MDKKKITGIIGIIFSLTLLSMFIPLDSPTGHVTSPLPNSNQPIGEFKSNTDFNIEIDKDYNFNVFEKINEEINKLSGLCEKESDRKGCIKGFLNKTNPLNITIGPQNKSIAEILNFNEQIYWCEKSANTACYCNITMNKSLNSFKEVYNNINIYKNGNMIFFQLPNKEYTFETNLLNDILELKNQVKNSNNFFYLKKETNSLNFIQDITGLPKCAIDQKIFAFSIPGPKKSLFYNEDENEYVFENPDIEFSVYLRDTEPPKQPIFDAKPLKNRNKIVSLNWEKPNDKDVENYYIVYSENPLVGDLKDYLDKSSPSYIDPATVNIKIIDVFMDLEWDFNYADYKKDSFDVVCNSISRAEPYCNSNITFYDENANEIKINLELSKLYFFDTKSEVEDDYDDYDEFLTFIELPDEANYVITIISEDTSGNMKKFEDLSIKNIQASDDLRPSLIFEPGKEPTYNFLNDKEVEFDFTNSELKNFDGTTLTDFDSYWIYWETLSNTRSDKVIYLKNTLPKEYSLKQIDGKLKMSNIKKGEFCYFILPMDKNYDKVKTKYEQIFSVNSYYNYLNSDLLKYNCI